MNVIDEAIVEEVRRRPDQVEASDGVRILLAVESGSRARLEDLHAERKVQYPGFGPLNTLFRSVLSQTFDRM